MQSTDRPVTAAGLVASIWCWFHLRLFQPLIAAPFHPPCACVLSLTGDRKSRKDRKEERKARKGGGGGASGAGGVSTPAPTAEELAAVNARPKDAPRTWVRSDCHLCRSETVELRVFSQNEGSVAC